MEAGKISSRWVGGRGVRGVRARLDSRSGGHRRSLCSPKGAAPVPVNHLPTLSSHPAVSPPPPCISPAVGWTPRQSPPTPGTRRRRSLAPPPGPRLPPPQRSAPSSLPGLRLASSNAPASQSQLIPTALSHTRLIAPRADCRLRSLCAAPAWHRIASPLIAPSFFLCSTLLDYTNRQRYSNSLSHSMQCALLHSAMHTLGGVTLSCTTFCHNCLLPACLAWHQSTAKQSQRLI